jgi:hypothetical protein
MAILLETYSVIAQVLSTGREGVVGKLSGATYVQRYYRPRVFILDIFLSDVQEGNPAKLLVELDRENPSEVDNRKPHMAKLANRMGNLEEIQTYK